MHFLEKRPLTAKFSKFYSKGFTASPIDVVAFKSRKILRREKGEIVRYLPHTHTKIYAASQTVASARIAPKMCHGQQCTQSSPDVIQIGSLRLAEL